MLKETTREEWLSILGLPPENVPEVIILRGTRNLKMQYELHKPMFQEIFEICSPNGLVEDVFIGKIQGKTVGYASVYGAPMASEVTHIFGVLGTKLVIQTGCCGALHEGILAGDILCPTSAYMGDGASQYYLERTGDVDASGWLIEKIGAGRHGGTRLYTGPIFTTSALLAEGENEIDDWRKKGYFGVDMETASTFAVAKYFGVDRISLLYVFDELRKNGSTLLEESKGEMRKRGETEMKNIALKIIKEYSKS